MTMATCMPMSGPEKLWTGAAALAATTCDRSRYLDNAPPAEVCSEDAGTGDHGKMAITGSIHASRTQQNII